MVIFAACTAARIGEVSGCRVKDVDTTEWKWQVRRQTTTSPGGLVDKTDQHWWPSFGTAHGESHQERRHEASPSYNRGHVCRGRVLSATYWNRPTGAIPALITFVAVLRNEAAGSHAPRRHCPGFRCDISHTCGGPQIVVPVNQYC